MKNENAECHNCKHGIPKSRLCYLGGWKQCKGRLFEKEKRCLTNGVADTTESSSAES